eukprot:TRINITY_DN8540_c0_g2_i1.p1 TRINITY_DN8540_c0_g2~~TRINITY_DN8540_c0_g2_i1.p1  ORF type:complete len:140 (+),score=42.54 TRINITY_DN8540_c0_g2_i1:55-420(+)
MSYSYPPQQHAPSYAGGPQTPQPYGAPAPVQARERQHNKVIALILCFCCGPIWRIYIGDVKNCLLHCLVGLIPFAYCICWILDFLHMDELIDLAEDGGFPPFLATPGNIELARPPQGQMMS